jgi:hypothetical protein
MAPDRYRAPDLGNCIERAKDLERNVALIPSINNGNDGCDIRGSRPGEGSGGNILQSRRIFLTPAEGTPEGGTGIIVDRKGK